MSKAKGVADISKEIIQKLDKAITHFYEKYKLLLDKAKEIYQQKYTPLWNEVYNDKTTTKQEQEQLKESNVF